MRFIKTLVGSLFFIATFFVTVAFVASNAEAAVLDLIVISKFSASLGKIVLVAFILGGLMGLLAASLIIVKQRGDRVRLEKRLHSTTRLMSGM